MPAITLAIDTAAPRLQLGLLLADGTSDFIVDDIAKGHAEILFARLDTLLSRNNVSNADIERIAVTTGPGSFTGLRIGLSAARGLGVARKIPVLGIPSLLALSLTVASGPVAIFLDARRDEAYFQTFSAPGVPETPVRLLPLEEARAAIPDEATLVDSPFVDIVAMARFAAEQNTADYPPHASYVRDADAKPQNASRIPRRV
ncbi:tRNA (adenosine(37)-N6)-threonylcarbamoyltransferase complex dimerization subunit type 1 TsaB [Devosia sp. MC532]|uniref:tRNA (adenosine(37)-N6)-threonylcarbamoyltransferase complex dimerization subunit type 1 TsaB n=1 Tax=Devosia sp. MC532 TaxID=2799788 RepID=UPI0018F6DB01|nr:tRNA (adenosine(37)-N6)-threonylcarbamoyltransferase complex dimerization subunit type 1 TsaB [Devosia sp. MC532]MBJ7577276.1 tRNA (adenosine(37)-N6)-threonylcarbamoyltransferase complex dimerization subunit type 1 TsaB [Devosia sp. MC532]